MTDYTLYAVAMNLTYLALTLGVIRGMLWYFDRSLGVEFKADVWNKMARSPVALAQYHGLRFAGVCILASSFLR